MIVRKLSKEKLTDTYTLLQKNRKKIKTRSLLLAFFVFGVNIFAWFVFISKANVTFNANVVSWDVNFSDSSQVISNVVINVSDLYPGMPTYKKEIYITNSSDVGGLFEYDINSILMFGEEELNDISTDAITYLEDTFPFIVKFGSTKLDLEKKDSLVFTITIDWPKEKEDDLAKDYYMVTKHYTFDPTVTYYRLLDGAYSKVENITEDDFNINKANYFLEKDDADSFFGSSCKKYHDTYGKSCFSFKLLLKVIQKEE